VLTRQAGKAWRRKGREVRMEGGGSQEFLAVGGCGSRMEEVHRNDCECGNSGWKE
jgi:hypothetical protein